MIVYLDVILFENILMNILIIYSANYVLKNKISYFKIFIGSILGAIYYVALILPQTNFLNFYAYKLILSIIIVLISFKYVDIYSFMKCLGSFYLVSFIYGGAAYGLYYFLLGNDIEYFSFKILIIFSISILLFIKNMIYTIRSNISYSKYTYDVDIYINNRMKRLKGFLDTGNNMKDPITNKPIIVVEFQNIKELLPIEIVEVVNNGISSFENLSDKYLGKVKLLPYISVGQKNGLMFGYKADTIKIYINKEERIVKNNIILGLNITKLSSKNDFNALLSIELLESMKGVRHEKSTIR